MKTFWVAGLIALPTMLCLTASAEPREISIWTRAPGDYIDGGAPKRIDETRLDLNQLKLEEKHLFDIQYGKSANYRAAKLNDVVQKYLPKNGADLALLHFAKPFTHRGTTQTNSLCKVIPASPSVFLQDFKKCYIDFI